jgi:transmembrane sensor
METSNNNPGPEIIARYFAGEASPEEAMMIDEWLQNAPDREDYEEVQKLWNLLPGAARPQVPTMEQAWQEINAATAHRPAKVRRFNWTRAATAAVVAGLAVLGALFFLKQKTPVAKEKEQMVWQRTAASDSALRMTMTDSSTIFLNRNSVVLYNQAFNRTERRLELKGEAFFDVAHDPSKPFIITIGGLSIRVVGTSFNVQPSPDSSIIEVQVQSGTVRLSANGKDLLVTRGQTGIYQASTYELELKNGIDINEMGYATKNFVFDDLPLSEACHYLERSFNVSIKMQEENFTDCRITAQFDNKPLAYILDVMAATVNASYSIEGKNVHIKGQGCKE